tara:strand:+ start:1552 stop:1725 length:174 start_codon:yes stop_codon:yes gene_type:complete
MRTIDPNYVAMYEENVENIESTSYYTRDPLEILIEEEELINDMEINPRWRRDGELYE